MREENYFYPRLGALSGVPFREVYRILRVTPYGHLQSCTSLYTPSGASRKITPNIAPIRSVSRTLHARLHLDSVIL